MFRPAADRRCRFEEAAIKPDADMGGACIGAFSPTALLKLMDGMIHKPQEPASRRPETAGAVGEQDIAITESCGIEM